MSKIQCEVEAIRLLGVPDDLDIVLDSEVPELLDDDLATRIATRTLYKLQSKDRMKRIKLVTIAVVLGCCLLVTVGHPGLRGGAWALLKETVVHVPGFGGQNATLSLVAAPGPVVVQLAQGTVEVHGLISTENMVTLRMTYPGSVSFSITDSFLVDSKGHTYPSIGGRIIEFGDHSRSSSEALLSFRPSLPPDLSEVTLILGRPDHVRVTIPLVTSDKLSEIVTMGSTHSRSGISLRLFEDQAMSDDLYLNLLIEQAPTALQPIGFGSYAPYLQFEGRNQTLAVSGPGASQRHWYLSAKWAKQGQGTASVVIPSLKFTLPSTATLFVPRMTTATRTPVNQTLSFGPYTLIIHSVEIMKGPKGESLVRFQVSGQGPEGHVISAFGRVEVQDSEVASWSSSVDPETGSIISFTTEMPDTGDSFRVSLHNLIIEVSGPWEYRLPTQ